MSQNTDIVIAYKGTLGVMEALRVRADVCIYGIVKINLG